MKGISNWIWVAGGVIAGLIIFSIAYNQIVQVSLSRVEQRSLEQFDETKNIVNNQCWNFVGNKREYTVDLGETIEGVYIATNPYEEYEKEQLIGKIVSGENTTGNYFCIKVKDKRLRCEELECNTTMPFMGSVPEEFSLSALLNKLMGRGKVYSYNIMFERKETKVEVEFITD
jgi:cytochrome c oxidase assembly protein Cox11